MVRPRLHSAVRRRAVLRLGAARLLYRAGSAPLCEAAVEHRVAQHLAQHRLVNVGKLVALHRSLSVSTNTLQLPPRRCWAAGAGAAVLRFRRLRDAKTEKKQWSWNSSIDATWYSMYLRDSSKKGRNNVCHRNLGTLSNQKIGKNLQICTYF